MKKNYPPALIVLELPDFKKHRSKLDFPLFSLTVILFLLLVAGLFGDYFRSLSADKSAEISHGIQVISENSEPAI